MDERLTAIRRRMRELEARQKELEAVAERPLDVDALTTQALAHIAKFREVLDQVAPSFNRRSS